MINGPSYALRLTMTQPLSSTRSCTLCNFQALEISHSHTHHTHTHTRTLTGMHINEHFLAFLANTFKSCLCKWSVNQIRGWVRGKGKGLFVNANAMKMLFFCICCCLSSSKKRIRANLHNPEQQIVANWKLFSAKIVNDCLTVCQPHTHTYLLPPIAASVCHCYNQSGTNKKKNKNAKEKNPQLKLTAQAI